METMKTEFINKIDDLNKCNTINVHQNALLQSKLNAQMNIDHEHSRLITNFTYY